MASSSVAAQDENYLAPNPNNTDALDQLIATRKFFDSILDPCRRLFDDNFKQAVREYVEVTSDLLFGAETEQQQLFGAAPNNSGDGNLNATPSKDDYLDSVPNNGDKLALAVLKTLRRKIDLDAEVNDLTLFHDTIKANVEELRRSNENLHKVLTEFDVHKGDQFTKEIAEKRGEMKFFSQKSQKYAAEREALEREMRRRGLSDDLRWPNLNAKRKRFDALREQVRKLDSQLAAYRDLPTDVDLARVRVEEKRQELKSIEDDLSKLVSGIESL